MHALEHAVLGVFKASPDETRSTTELVQELLPHEWNAVMEHLHSVDPARIRKGKAAKARLHRKLLYHVNKLVEDGLVKVHTVQGRGEKRFAATSGEVEIRSGRKQIRIHVPTKISTPVDEAPHTIIFDREHWLSRVNAVLVEGLRHDTLAGLSDTLNKLAPFVNDAIGVTRAETLLDGTIAEYEDFLEGVRRMPCVVSLLISMGRVGEDAKLLRFCKTLADKQSRAQIVFTVTPQSLQERRDVLTNIIELFAEKNIKVNIKNSGVFAPPVFCGRGGPYAMSQEDWDAYQEQRASARGVVVSAASIAVDVGAAEQPHKLVRQASEALFLGGRARDLQGLRALGIVTGYITDVVRIWNYDAKNELVVAEMEGSLEAASDFCTIQERVYRACGLPIRCRVGLSCAFGTFPGVSARSYVKHTIKGLSSLQEEQFGAYLNLREEVGRRFISDRVRIFRSGDVNAVAVLREFSYVLNSFRLPFVTYDFRNLQGTIRLTEFFGGES